MSNQPLLWVHDDALGPDQPIFRHYADAPAIYVFDDQLIDYRGYGIKRLGFITECLGDLDVTTYRGDTASCLLAMADHYGADTIAMMETPCPKLKEITIDLRQQISVEVVENTVFVDLEKEPDLKRFSRYWRQAQKSALQSTDLPLFKRPVP